MLGLTLADALRYFFAPFVLFFYLAVYDAQLTTKLQQSFGPVGVISFLVAGSVLYFLYRNLLYDPFILWLHDIFRKQTYRRYLGEKYKLCHGGWSPACTLRALKLYHQVHFPDEKPRAETARIRAAGVHLLYQAGLLAIPFVLISRSLFHIAFFATLALILCSTAVLADKNYEEEELIALKLAPKETDKAAKVFGYAKK